MKLPPDDIFERARFLDALAIELGVILLKASVLLQAGDVDAATALLAFHERTIRLAAVDSAEARESGRAN